MEDLGLLHAVAIVPGQHMSYALLNSKNEWHFHLKKQMFSYMKNDEAAYVVRVIDSVPVMMNDAPVIAVKKSGKELKVITKADLYHQAKQIITQMNGLTGMPKYRVDNFAVSNVAIKMLDLIDLADIEVLPDLLREQWVSFPSDYDVLKK